MIKNIVQTLILGSIFPYCLIADDIYEPNNTINNAKLLNTGHYTLYSQDDDWFKVNVSPGTLTLTMTPTIGDINMILYNSAGQIIASAFANSQENIRYSVVAGTYYIQLHRVTNTPEKYNLDIQTASNGNWEKTLDFGPISDVSVALYDIDNDGKDEIFVATSKALDPNNNFAEIRPAGLICLEDDGTIKWTRTFPAMSTPDIQTGMQYNTTSVSTTPFFSNIDDDPEMEILIGVGAGYSNINISEPIVGQPGDKGGLYALESDGTIKWFHQSLDIIGGSANIGDNRPDGVYGSPIVYDIDNDGAREVIYNSWDQRTWILNAQTGTVKTQIQMYDTIWSTPAIADINNDGNEEILVTADITENATVGTKTGGIFHVVTHYGTQNISGFDTPLAKPEYKELHGKYEEQVLWSSPIVADLDNDGFFEIIYGTGNFLPTTGEFIRVWNHDGSPKFKLTTIGKTFATPLIADINNDGKLEIIACTLEGYVYAWDNQGNILFTSQIDSNAIFSSPIAIDTNNDGNLEIIYTSGAQITIIDSKGNRVNAPLSMINQFYKGTPAVNDIDNNGVLDLISGGTTSTKDQAVVYKWTLVGSNANARIGKNQYIGSNTNIKAFVSRFYKEVLGRLADVSGLNDWTEKLITGTYAGADIARGFIFSNEFTNKNTDDLTFITTLYKAFFNRAPDNEGLDSWLVELNAGKSRFDLLDGFLYSQEFINLSRTYNIKPIKEINNNRDIEAFVQRFYQEILGRFPDDIGLIDWTNRLASRENAGADIARGFIFSDEFTQKNTDNITFIKILYKAFFARDADINGLNGWVNALNSGTSRYSVLDGFLFSNEFSTLSQSYGILAVK